MNYYIFTCCDIVKSDSWHFSKTSKLNRGFCRLNVWGATFSKKKINTSRIQPKLNAQGISKIYFEKMDTSNIAWNIESQHVYPLNVWGATFWRKNKHICVFKCNGCCLSGGGIKEQWHWWRLYWRIRIHRIRCEFIARSMKRIKFRLKIQYELKIIYEFHIR